MTKGQEAWLSISVVMFLFNIGISAFLHIEVIRRTHNVVRVRNHSKK